MSNYHPSIDRYDGRMRYRRCGKSGIVLPEISLGLWHNFGDTARFETCLEMVRYAFDQGITHFDLANNYGPAPGAAEETFGRILRKSRSIPREELIISSKAGHTMWNGPYGDGSSRKMLITSLDQSLQRMGLDYVDIFYSHRFDPKTPIEETLQSLVDIVRSGKALYAGISKYPQAESAFAYHYLRDRNVPCLIYQGRYNMFDREVENGTIEEAYRNGSGFIAFSPLAQGLLSDRYLNGIPNDSRIANPEGYLKEEQLTESVLCKIKALNTIATERQQSLAQMALAWVLRDIRITSVIVGASSVDQLKSNLQAIRDLTFSETELSTINEILLSSCNRL